MGVLLVKLLSIGGSIIQKQDNAKSSHLEAVAEMKIDSPLKRNARISAKTESK